ncbi:hypothetical protein BKA57DRAFT_510589 [Linnemannia elongata]|nr:hypothetical protein BKA57DRAFT_510589 [Linnemannia elongata]
MATCIAYSPSSDRIATSSEDGTAPIRDPETGNELLRCVGHEGIVTNVAFSPSGYQIATSGSDWSVRLWNAAVITAATLPWRDSADSSNAYMEVILLSNAQGYFAFSTDWHIFSGVISSSATLEEFVTDIVPVCLENGVLRGLMEFIDVV